MVTVKGAIPKAAYNFLLVFCCNYAMSLSCTVFKLLTLVCENKRGHATLTIFCFLERF